MYGMMAYELGMLALSGLLVVHATLSIIPLWKNRAKATVFQWIQGCLWFSIVVYILTLWPNSSYPYDSPRSSFLLFSAMIAFVIVLIRNQTAAPSWLRRSVIVTGIFGVLFVAFRSLLVLKRGFVSEDFFYYVCVARHMAAGIGDLSPLCYFYFPGIFRFWRMAFDLTNGSLGSLQNAFLFVICANAVMMGGIVQRVTRNVYLAVPAGLWYVLFCYRFGGFLGIAEPIATLPILAGLLFWAGKPFLDSAGMWRLFALGAGLGMGVYIRQQAGFVSLGAISILLTNLLQPGKVINTTRLLLLPLIAVILLLSGILLEGHGLQPLITGVMYIPGYPFDLRSATNGALTSFAMKAPLLTTFSVLAISLWFALLLSRKLRGMIAEPRAQMLGFSALAGIFSLIPYLGRPHPHYALFGGPMLILASCFTASILIQWIPGMVKRSAIFYFAVVLLALMPFVRSHTPHGFYMWPPEKPAFPARLQPAYLSPGPMADFEFMKKQITPYEKIYVLPPSENQVHFFLQTTFPNYGWYRPFPLTEAIHSPNLKGVIVVKKNALFPYYLNLARTQNDYDSANKILKMNGFQPVINLSTMVLWRK